MRMKKAVECCCAWAGKTGGAIWVCLDFWAPPFASRQKVENINNNERHKEERLSLQCFAKLSMTSTSDKCNSNYLEHRNSKYEGLKKFAKAARDAGSLRQAQGKLSPA